MVALSITMNYTRWMLIGLLVTGLVAGSLAGAALASDDTSGANGNQQDTDDAATNETATNTSTTNETATGDDSGADTRQGNTTGGQTQRDQAQAAREARMAYIEEMRAARQAALTSFHENRTAAIAEYRESVNATRGEYLATREAIVEACRADGPEDMANATEEDREAFAQCVSDGLEEPKAQAEASLESAREAFTARLTGVRDTLIQGFLEIRDEMRARHGQEDGGDQ